MSNIGEITVYTDMELLYAAKARCYCGAGMAYPLDLAHAMESRAWQCSAVLKGETTPDRNKHAVYPFAFYKIREETSINNHGGYTTRPTGTKAYTVGYAACPACGHEWHSEPYVACGLSHHWFSGSCPNCSYDVGGKGTWCSGDGESIEHRYRDEVSFL